MQKASFEELFPNVSSYVNSDEIVPVSTLQDNSSNEVVVSNFPSLTKRNNYFYTGYFVYEILYEICNSVEANIIYMWSQLSDIIPNKGY